MCSTWLKCYTSTTHETKVFVKTTILFLLCTHSEKEMVVLSIKKLENTQKLALKICSKQWDNLSYQDLLDLAKCPTLRNRRLYFKLCTLYKIVHKLIYFPVDILPLRSNLSAPVPLLHQPFARTNSFFSSFVLSSISLWNNLPHEALTADSIHSFKSSLCPLFLCP